MGAALTGYLWRGRPWLEEVNAAIMAARPERVRKVSHGLSGYQRSCRCEVCVAAKRQENARNNPRRTGG